MYNEKQCLYPKFRGLEKIFKRGMFQSGGFKDQMDLATRYTVSRKFLVCVCVGWGDETSKGVSTQKHTQTWEQS